MFPQKSSAKNNNLLHFVAAPELYDSDESGEEH